MDSRRKRIIDNSVLVVPNLFTTANLFCGFYSVISSLNGHYIFAAYLVLAAALFDMVDGRVARWTNGTTDFGREYDSLCDLVSFGVAPGLLTYLCYLSSMPRIGWLVVFLYIACGALRLAKFNVSYVNYDPRYFKGLPIPVAAVSIASGFLFFNNFSGTPYKNYYFMFIMLAVSILMVSSIKYKSYKKPEKTVRQGFYTNTILFLLVLVIAATNPDIAIFSLCVLYLVQGVVSSLFRSLRNAFKKSREHRKH